MESVPANFHKFKFVKLELNTFSQIGTKRYQVLSMMIAGHLGKREQITTEGKPFPLEEFLLHLAHHLLNSSP